MIGLMYGHGSWWFPYLRLLPYGPWLGFRRSGLVVGMCRFWSLWIWGGLRVGVLVLLLVLLGGGRDLCAIVWRRLLLLVSVDPVL